ncbi:Ig-like domain-containing protein [Agrococcus jejuensis]|nr:LPXTG cell wall anchor domain-containing protein [Agrococcus jejuensis]
MPQRLRRTLAGALSTMLVAGGLTAVAIGAPIVAAPAANAADPFTCSANTIYATSTGDPAPQAQRSTIGRFTVDGTGSIAATQAYDSGITAGNLNQLAIGPDGTDIFFTQINGGVAQVFHYEPQRTGTAADPNPTVVALPTTGVGSVTGTTMGGFDPLSGRYVFGGFNSDQSRVVLSTFDPDTNAVRTDVARVTLPNTPGNNGDLAFDTAGVMYIVSGGNASAGGQIYRITQPIPETGDVVELTGTNLGQRIGAGETTRPGAINSIAFASDGYLYLYATSGTAGVVRVNPSSGAVTGTGRTLTGDLVRASDFGTCATPSTASGSITVPAPVKPTDSFDVVVTGPDTPASETGNQGSTGPIEEGPGEAEAGPILVLPGQPVEVELTPTPETGTNIDDYDPSWQCVDPSRPADEQVVNSGWGTTASYIQPTNPAEGSTITCTFQTSGALTFLKTADVTTVDAIGDVITYTFTATNRGLAPIEDVEIADGMEGLSALECDPAQGSDLAPGASITCTATRTATADDFAAGAPSTITNTATAEGTKSQRDANGDVTTSTRPSITSTAVVTPNRNAIEVAPEESTGDEPGAIVTVPVAQGDDVVPGTIRIVGGTQGGKELIVDQGRWTVDDEAGTIVFTPNGPNSGDPAPIQYTAQGPNGVTSAPASVTVTYAGTVDDQRSDDNVIGTTVTIDPLAGAEGSIEPGSVRLVGPVSGLPVTSITLPNGATWTVVDDELVYAPNGVTTDPVPVQFQATTTDGSLVGPATAAITYTPEAVDDVAAPSQPRATATVQPLANDRGTIDPSTFVFLDEDGQPILDAETGLPLATVPVDGEGTWRFELVDGVVTVTFTPEEDFLTDPTSIDYRVAGPGEDRVTTRATISAPYLPLAQPDRNDPQASIGTDVVIDALANDTGTGLDPESVVLLDPETGEWVKTVTTDDGTYTVDPETGVVTFVPASGLVGDAEPITYRVEDVRGAQVTSEIVIAYVPTVTPDSSLGNEPDSTVVVDVLATDRGDFVPESLAIVTPTGSQSSYDVPEQGTWRIVPGVDGGLPRVEFEPLPTFHGNPTPVEYVVTDVDGDTDSALVTITYQPVAILDVVRGFAIDGEAVVDPLANDRGPLDPSTLQVFDPELGEDGEWADSVEVAGQGVWTVETRTIDGVERQVVVFTPAESYEGDPDPIRYRVSSPSATEEPVESTVQVFYVPTAQSHELLLQTITEDVTFPNVLDGAKGELDRDTFTLVDRSTGRTVTEPGTPLVVDGEGTWTFAIDEDGAVSVTFSPLTTFVGDPRVIDYTIENLSEVEVGGTLTITYQPEAEPDVVGPMALDAPAVIRPLANDTGVFDLETFRLFDPTTGQWLEPLQSLDVADEGVWSVEIVDGEVVVTFTPDEGYEGDPALVRYQVGDAQKPEVLVESTITVDYQPEAANDGVEGVEPRTDATVEDILGNDRGELVPGTVAFVPAGASDADALAPGEALVVEGEGVWTIVVDDETGLVSVVFSPERDFLSDPTPVRYVVEDGNGSVTGALVTVDYLQSAADDEMLDQPITQPVTVDILPNDVGTFDESTLAFYDAANGVWLEDRAPLTVLGEGTWTFVDDEELGRTVVVFTPDEGYLGDPETVRYRVADVGGDVVEANVTVSFVPLAVDDESLGNVVGTTVSVDVLGNDTGDFVPASVRIVAGEERVTSLVVAGEGEWIVDAETGAIAFVPEAGFDGDPTPIEYEVTDTTGDTVSATVTITYGITAVDDASRGNAFGTAVTVDVVANDAGGAVPGTVRIVSGDELVLELVVRGEGTWTVDPETGAITFTPEAGFTRNPTPITYVVEDADGFADEAQVVVTYLPVAHPDVVEDAAPGQPVTVDPLANDTGDLDPTTVEIRDPQTGEWGKDVTVPGEGTWTVDPVTGAITFTPAPGFTGSPTPIDYRVTDGEGNVTQSTLTIGYAAVAPAPGLPRTGAELALWTLVAGLGLLLAGAAVWLVRRRRAGAIDA